MPRPALLARSVKTIFVTFAAIALSAVPVPGSTLWSWNYTAPGITAAGTFTTDDTPSAAGAYLITSMSGTRNGVQITGLQAAGTAIPGNEPYAVDDLVAPGPGPQLTENGFGFSMADGNFANPFFADFASPPAYLEFFSAPPFTDGGQGAADSEVMIDFAATPVPEPRLSLIAAAFALGAGWHAARKRST